MLPYLFYLSLSILLSTFGPLLLHLRELHTARSHFDDILVLCQKSIGEVLPFNGSEPYRASHTILTVSESNG